MNALRLPLTVAAVSVLLTACETTSKDKAQDKPGEKGHPVSTSRKAADEGSAGGVSIPFLLSMDFSEASAISEQTGLVPPFVKVAADKVEVLKRGPDGKPRKLRATGHVFVQIDYQQQVRALAQEAFITDEDVTLRGNPIMQRGSTTAEGLSDVTVFYLIGTHLRVIGEHRMTNTSEIVHRATNRVNASTVALASPGADPGIPLPTLPAWSSGPNPLLPPLNGNDVPESVRDELRKAAEAEALLQKSRVGKPPAFPETVPPSQLVPAKP